MTFPVLFHIGSQDIPLHAICEVLAFFIGYRYFLWLKKRTDDPVNTENRYWIIIGAAAGALVGSRLLGSLENPDEWLQASNKLLYFYQSKTVVGGFLGGLAGVEITKKLIGERQSSGDLFVYPMILALIIGRIGCFSMGTGEETYGITTKLPLGMNLGDGLMRHPVALYEIAFLLFLWFILSQVSVRFSLKNGGLFILFMTGYLLFRFLLDLIKPHSFSIFGLSSIQWTCLAGLLYYYRYLLRPEKLTTAYA